MPEATLKITAAGGPEAVAAIRDLEQALAAAQGRIDKLAESSRARRVRGARAERQTVVQEAVATAQGVGGAYRQGRVVVEREEKLVTRSKLRELALQGEAQKKFVELFTRCHAQATAAFEREVGKRGELSDREKRQVETVALAMVAAHEQAERRKTQTTEREERRRVAERNRNIGRAVGRTLTGAASGALNYATDMHGQIQGARHQRAADNRALRNALGGAGIQDYQQGAQQQIQGFVERTGMSYTDVVAALRLGQQRGSALEQRGRTPERTLADALRVIQMANGTDVDPGQLLAARGRLSTAGIAGEALDDMMRYVVYAADRGQVEVDQIIQQGLPGATRLMGSRTGAMANASPEQRQRAAVSAFRESVAVQEVFAGTGVGPTRASNTLASLQGFLSTPRRQELLLQNLRTHAEGLSRRNPEGAARRAAIEALYSGENSLFERDPTRRDRNAMRLRAGVSPLLLADRMSEAMGGNAQAAASILAGGGHGNAQSLLVNMRTMLEVLGSINPETGQRRTEAVRSIMTGNYTREEIEQRQRGVETDDLANVNRVENARANALTNAGDWRVQRSNQFADWAARNPFEASAVQQSTQMLGGILAPAVERGMSSAVERVLNARGAPSGGAPGTSGVPITPGAAAGGLGFFGGLTVTAALALMASSAETAVTGRTLGGGRANNYERVNAGLNSVTVGGAFSELGRQAADYMLRSLRSEPLRAEISAQDATHAATVNTTPRAAP